MTRPSQRLLHATFVLLAAALSAQTAPPATVPSTEPAIASPPATAPAAAAATGSIVGVLKSPSSVTRIVAVDRQWSNVLKVSTDNPKDEFVYPGKWDEKTGAFVVTGLLPGHTYDLIAWNAQGRWEGVTMDYHRPILPGKPVTDEDKAWLKEFVEKTQSFYDQSRILWMAADHQHATLLVELKRTRGFHSGVYGEVIYRTELWYFENYFGGWAKDKNTERVITRWRGQSDAFPKNWQYVPQLGGITIPTTGTSTPVQVTLPDKPDAKRGVANGLPLPDAAPAVP